MKYRSRTIQSRVLVNVHQLLPARFHFSNVSKKKERKNKSGTKVSNPVFREARIKIPLILTDYHEFAYEKRNGRTCATWTRRVRRAAPVATATPRTPRAPTWPPSSDRPNTTAVFIWGWARWRSGSGPWSTRASSSANTSSSSRTPSATTSCSPSRRRPGWRSSSYRCILYFSTTRFVRQPSLINGRGEIMYPTRRLTRFEKRSRLFRQTIRLYRAWKEVSLSDRLICKTPFVSCRGICNRPYVFNYLDA